MVQHSCGHHMLAVLLIMVMVTIFGNDMKDMRSKPRCLLAQEHMH